MTFAPSLFVASPASLILGLLAVSALHATAACRPHSIAPRRPLRGSARLLPRPRRSFSASLPLRRCTRRRRVGLTQSRRVSPFGAPLGWCLARVAHSASLPFRRCTRRRRVGLPQSRRVGPLTAPLGCCVARVAHSASLPFRRCTRRRRVGLPQSRRV